MPSPDDSDRPASGINPLDVSMRLASIGDRCAMEQVYRIASRRVQTLLGRLLPTQDVEDALQETFLAIWRASSFDPDRAGAMTWILTIARRKAYDRLRTDRMLRRVFEPLAGNDSADPRPSWLQLRSDADGRRRLHQALRGLPGPQRELLAAVFVDGLSYVALSARTGVSASTLKSRVGRALISLRRQLQVE